MVRTFTFVCLFVFCIFSAAAQEAEKNDREKSRLNGYVKSVIRQGARLVMQNGKLIERNFKLESITTYDIAGKKLTSNAYSGDGELLYGDKYFYDEKDRLIESVTEHSKFVYLCDKETYLYDERGRLTERNCHLNEQGIIGKTIYRYNPDGRLFEEERLPIVEAKLYFSRNSLRRYQYKKNGELEEVLTFDKEFGELKPTKEYFNDGRNLFFSTADNGNFTQLKFDDAGKLKFVVTSFGDGKGNPTENITYYADGSISEGSRYEYEYDSMGNAIKGTKYKWITEDGKSFFQPAEVSYFKIEYFGEQEIREFEAKNKPPDKQKEQKNPLQ